MDNNLCEMPFNIKVIYFKQSVLRLRLVGGADERIALKDYYGRKQLGQSLLTPGLGPPFICIQVSTLIYACTLHYQAVI